MEIVFSIVMGSSTLQIRVLYIPNILKEEEIFWSKFKWNKFLYEFNFDYSMKKSIFSKQWLYIEILVYDITIN